MTTIKKTDLYDHKSPPRQKAVVNDEPLCPMTRKRCLVYRCVIWDDERDTCALHPANLYNKTREAVTDALVDLKCAYSGGESRG